MEDKKFKVTFLPSKKTCMANVGADLLSTAIECGEYIHSSCGGDGICGRCKVLIKKGEYRTQPTGRISYQDRMKGYVLACLTTVQGDLEVHVPKESRLLIEKITDEDSKFLRLSGMYSQAADVSAGGLLIKEEIYTHSPLATKLYLEIPPPNSEDKISDLERLDRAIKEKKDVKIMQTGLRNIRQLGSLLRQSDWKVTVTLGKRNETTEVVIIEPGNTENRNYGIAFDIGTTTVTGQLVNLNTKEVLGTKATHNKQAAFGDDVITRIIYATEENGLERLHHAVIDNMNEIIKQLILKLDINLNDITGVMCAGNTTMMHLLLKIDPTYIRKEPYVPTANFLPVIRAAEAGIKIHPRGLLSCVPGISTYVGGDITAGVLASGLSEEKKTTLLIDIGTNGEVVLGNSDWMVCASASAGPAFEGSGVSCGMRAINGAIEKVVIDKNLNVRYETIGNDKPIGICGSGYIDLLCEIFKANIINRDGRINTLKTERIRDLGDGLEFVLAFKEESSGEFDIVIKESDIENLKRSKAAIYSAASILVKKMGLNFNNIERAYIAGGFGNCIDISKAVCIGLLPDLPKERFKFIGNSSIIGAREIMLSFDAMKKAEEIARKMTYLELSNDHGYMEEYVSGLFFPHTDLERFPSVKK